MSAENTEDNKGTQGFFMVAKDKAESGVKYHRKTFL